MPELAEHFIISLVSTISGDGKPGSTPTSGASIDPEKMSTEVTIKPSDHPYGKYTITITKAGNLDGMLL